MDKSMPKLVWITLWLLILMSCHFWLVISWGLTESVAYGEPLAIAQFAWLVWLYCDGLSDESILLESDL